jgi:predicted Rossmann fold flavoprotein
MSQRRVIVIGGGASGLVAAGRASSLGAEVLLLEKTDSPGSKLLLTGQGRCNLSHTSEASDFVPHYNEGRFLHQAFSRFFRDDLIHLLGIKTKTEADGRVFPASEDAHEVLSALLAYAKTAGVLIRENAAVAGIITQESRVAGVRVGEEILPADAVILASGGSSYPATGSSGDGYLMAKALGHSIVSLRPALVPLRVVEKDATKAMQGASLQGVRLTAFRCPARDITPDMTPRRDYGRGLSGKPAAPVIESRTGDVLFAHFRPSAGQRCC